MGELEGAPGACLIGLRPRCALIGQRDCPPRNRQALRILNRSRNRARRNLCERIQSCDAEQEQHNYRDSPTTVEIHPGLPLHCQGDQNAHFAAVFPMPSLRNRHTQAPLHTSQRGIKNLSYVLMNVVSPLVTMAPKGSCAKLFTLVNLL